MIRQERAREYRKKIEAVIQGLDVPDEELAQLAELHPLWERDTDYVAGQRRQWDGVLYKCRQNHTSQAHYTPDMIPALWAVVGASGGTKDNPITAAKGMEYTYGLYYRDPEDGKTYLCTRIGAKDGETIVLQYLPHELIGNYFKLA